MGLEALKLELIEWLAQMDNKTTIEYLKVVKDSSGTDGDWWNDLSDTQKAGIGRVLEDGRNGRTTPHETVKTKYGL